LIRISPLFVAILLVHALALYWLAMATRFVPPPPGAVEIPVQVDFIFRKRPSSMPQLRADTPLRSSRSVSPESPRNNPADPVEMRKQRIQASITPSITLINKDGSISLPEHVRDEFLDNVDDREFDVQQKGLDDMDKLLRRPIALEYQTTRFDKDWQGDKLPLARILEEAVAKSTVRVKIPIPGRPGAYLRCGLAVLALGGGCGFTANDDGYFVRGDDPDTLSPEEDLQCKAWWDLIVSAKTQTLWRKTRQLYEQECNKPLAK
jgi:hypothetical protein